MKGNKFSPLLILFVKTECRRNNQGRVFFSNIFTPYSRSSIQIFSHKAQLCRIFLFLVIIVKRLRCFFLPWINQAERIISLLGLVLVKKGILKKMIFLKYDYDYDISQRPFPFSVPEKLTLERKYLTCDLDQGWKYRENFRRSTPKKRAEALNSKVVTHRHVWTLFWFNEMSPWGGNEDLFKSFFKAENFRWSLIP